MLPLFLVVVITLGSTRLPLESTVCAMVTSHPGFVCQLAPPSDAEAFV